MKRLSMLRFVISRSGASELVLLLQLTCLAIFAIGIIQPMERYIHQIIGLERVYTWDMAKTFYINPGESVGSAQAIHQDIGQAEWQEKLSQTQGVLDVGASAICFGTYQPSGGLLTNPININIIVNSENQKQYIDLDLKEGTAGVVISSEMEEMYPVGSTIDLCLVEQNIEKTYTVTGILKPRGVVPLIAPHGTEAEMEAFAAFVDEYPDSRFVMIHDDLLLEELKNERNYWIVTTDGKEPVKDAILEAISGLGAVRTIGDAFSEVVGLILRRNTRLLFAFVQFLLIAVFGLGGYTYLLHQRRQRDFSVLLLCGATKRSISSYLFVAHVLLILISTWLGWLLEPKVIQRFLIQEQRQASWLGLVVCMALFVVILIFSEAYSYLRIRKLSVADLYRKGDA